MKKEELRVVPVKNYIILGIIVLVTLLLLYYFSMWIDVYDENRLNKPILDKYMEVINYNELDDYLIENPNTIIYVSILGDSEIRNFEKNFKRLFKNNLINKDMLYLNITNDILDNDIRNDMDNKYNINGINISDVPNLLVFDNGNLKSIYSIKENGYDVDRLKLFINGTMFNGDGEIDG